ncbi:MAG: radical SAM protein, partial [Thermoanaerobaculia bacterium]|nr:radical SAM protein [Thermoanaerobaculia bacterium]
MSRLDRELRSRRGPKAAVDPWRPLAAVTESERRPGGRIESGRTLFLAGAECPFTCVFCDLWRHTLDGPTPEGALPRQIEMGVGAGDPAWRWVKLYNASNFFDPRAVPAADHRAIARAVERFPLVVVESHPRLLGDPCRRFADLLSGRLEVALGLETVHPRALAALNKKLDLARYDAAVDWLRGEGIAVRAFVLLGAPFVPSAEQEEWTVASVRHALAGGAGSVSIIPVRGGGELDRVARSGDFTPPTLELAER